MKRLLAILLATATTMAAAHDNWINSTGDVWKNIAGQCWRNSSWTPATAHPDCDGAIKPAQTAVITVTPTAPAPTPKFEPAVPQAVKVSYSADTFFDFDKIVIKADGRAKLDDLISKIQGISLEVVIVVGHTDSIGTDAYNMKLGARRANAVKAYLVSRGIEPNRVYTESKGERQPVANNRTAQGRAKNRRVEIEVVGTRK